ncbi:GAF domain-containing protein [Pseudonocardia sp. ICBG601]|uniref:GAF domain-containing protein n=1 Tax=Pseudonocardia sp. ICBG601 TaxID=2846759 RepID=UPI001CF6E15E|nr:GAF domain-containing protein [Pseudonocardia sp. ICBG601]
MGDLLARRRELVSARAELLDRPDAAPPGVPGHVVASWRRSIAGGVDPATIANRFHPDLDTGSRLVRCARPVMEQLAEQVAGIGVCVALTDDRARLLVRLDTDAVIARSADVNAFAAGFGYADGAVGTNGVGTVLESGRPVHIVGAEHFVEQLHDYACAGAPVRDPSTGRVEAVLDLSCRAEHSSPLLLSLVRSAAARISDACCTTATPPSRPCSTPTPAPSPAPGGRCSPSGAARCWRTPRCRRCSTRTTTPRSPTTPGSCCCAAPASTTGWSCRRGRGRGCAARSYRRAGRSPAWWRW